MQEQIDTLLTELGPILNPAEISRSEENNWSIVLDEDNIIDIELEGLLKRILLSIQVGHIGRTNAEPVYKRLLQYNARWQETGGHRFSLLQYPTETEEVTEVNLMVELPVSELNVQIFLDIIQKFIEISTEWKGIIEQAFERQSDNSLQVEASPNSLVKF